MFVGRGQMAAAGKDETVRLGFGADDKLKIERAVVKRNEGSAGLIVTTSKTHERTFKTTVRNGHDFPIPIAIEDQLPVSENDDIVVEMLPSTTPPTAANLRGQRGRGLFAWRMATSQTVEPASAANRGRQDLSKQQ